MDEAQTNLYKAIVEIVNKSLSHTQANRYLTGKVVSVSGSKCNVTIDEDTITVPIRTGVSVSVNNIVYVCLPNGSLSNAFVDLVRPK